MTIKPRVFTFNEVRDYMIEMGARPIAFQRPYATIMGSAAGGVFLSQAVFFSTTFGRQRDGWFYQTQDQWFAETMCTRREQESARKRLKQLELNGVPLWEEKLKGLPATMNYRINLAVLFKLVAAIKSDQSVQTGEYDQSVQTSEADVVQTSEAEGYRPVGPEGTDLKESQPENQQENQQEKSAPVPGDADPERSIEVEFVRMAKHSHDQHPFTDTEGYAPISDAAKRVLDIEPTPKPTPGALADAYYKGLAVDRKMVAPNTFAITCRSFKPVVGLYSEEDVRGCVGYIRSDPWYQEPGRLTTKKLMETLPEWTAAGRPDAIVPRAKSPNGTPDRVTGEGWREIGRRIVAQENSR